MISKVLLGFAIVWFIIHLIFLITVYAFAEPLWTQVVSFIANLSWMAALGIEMNDEAKRREKEEPRPLDDTVEFSY